MSAEAETDKKRAFDWEDYLAPVDDDEEMTPEYIAYVNEKIRIAEAEIAAGVPTIPAEESWKELGIED